MLKRVASINRFALVAIGGFLIAIALLLVLAVEWWSDIVLDSRSARISFVMSLAEDITFFGLVGLAIFLQQLYATRGDILRKRVENLFANSALSYPAIEYVEGVIRRNAVYSKLTMHTLQVHEYSVEHRAYRVSFHNKYHLKNMFGDVEYGDELPAIVAPDLICDDIRPLGIVLSLSLTSDGNRREYLSGPIELSADGFKKTVPVQLSKNGEATYEMKWWSWVTNVGDSGFSIRRFSERTIIDVENAAPITIQLYRPEDPTLTCSLKTGEQVRIRDIKSVPEKTRLSFCWLPPVEYPERGRPNPWTGIHPILDDLQHS